VSALVRPSSPPRLVVVPVGLGCCPDRPRCLLCPPPPAPLPTPATVRALVDHYRSERLPAGGQLRAAFFGGPPPAEPMIRALDGLPWSARVRPDLLSRREAERLIEGGAVAVELDALSFDDEVLRGAGRRYRSRAVRGMVDGLREQEVGVGLVLTPGLPGSDHSACLDDARLAVELGVDTVRIHPVLVLDRSRLKRAHMDGLYQPLTLAEALTTCRAMMDLLEPAGVEVIRVGLQPGPDGFGRAVAGPRHPAFRQLVEARRTLDRLHGLLRDAPPGSVATIRCASQDETRTRGPMNQHLRDLRAEHRLLEVHVRPDSSLRRGWFSVEISGLPEPSARATGGLAVVSDHQDPGGKGA